jgi:hypothetical protein
VALTPAADGKADGDEFVARASAHVPTAESELFVNADHRNIDHTEVVAEILRILHLHAQRHPAP